MFYRHECRYTERVPVAHTRGRQIFLKNISRTYVPHTLHCKVSQIKELYLPEQPASWEESGLLGPWAYGCLFSMIL